MVTLITNISAKLKSVMVGEKETIFNTSAVVEQCDELLTTLYSRCNFNNGRIQHANCKRRLQIAHRKQCFPCNTDPSLSFDTVELYVSVYLTLPSTKSLN